MKSRIRLALNNRPLLVAWATIVFAVLGGIYTLDRNDAWEAYHRCQDTLASNSVLRDVVIEAYRPGQSLNLTALPSFAMLDVETQQYLRELESASQAGGTTTRRDELLALVPVPDCGGEPGIFPW